MVTDMETYRKVKTNMPKPKSILSNNPPLINCSKVKTKLRRYGLLDILKSAIQNNFRHKLIYFDFKSY